MKLEVSTSPEFETELRVIVRQEIEEVLKERQDDKPDYFNLGESAKYIHIARNTLTKLISSGDIKVTWIRGAQRISRKQLKQYMASKTI